MLTEEQIKAVKKKMKLNKRFKKRVQWFQLGQRRCHCCGVQLNWAQDYDNSATVEHMVPDSKGGTFHDENILITCRSCNSRRGNKDWIEYVTENNFPKSEWLIKKYLTAVEFYRTNNQKVHISIFHKVREYNNKIKKQQQKLAA
jgi:5-methylcytosine-specific restriction endonuclease McrA